jgi:hypothetical protein
MTVIYDPAQQRFMLGRRVAWAGTAGARVMAALLEAQGQWVTRAALRDRTGLSAKSVYDALRTLRKLLAVAIGDASALEADADLGVRWTGGLRSFGPHVFTGVRQPGPQPMTYDAAIAKAQREGCRLVWSGDCIGRQITLWQDDYGRWTILRHGAEGEAEMTAAGGAGLRHEKGGGLS